MAAAEDTNSERLTSLPESLVTTEGSHIFQNAGIFSIPEDDTILAVPAEGFHQATTSCPTTDDDDGSLLESHQNIDQHPESSLNQDQSAEKISGELLKKRRGGWPKGKKRKKDIVDLNRPKAPMTGYVRFLNSRRTAVKGEHPNLPSSQITKIIGTEWNLMSVAEKQVYHDQAEDDKRRYLEELSAYQQSGAYQAFLKRQQSKKLKDLGVENLEGLDPNFLTGNYQHPEAEERPELYCKACNQHFSSEHNKKEHMLGRQHLQMIAEEFEKESQTTLKTKSGTPGQPENLEKSPSVHEDETEMSEATKMTTLSDVMETLLQHNYDREMEIRELRKNVGIYENQRLLLSKELERLKKLVFQSEETLTASKSFHASLSNELQDLGVVPSLFEVLL